MTEVLKGFFTASIITHFSLICPVFGRFIELLAAVNKTRTDDCFEGADDFRKNIFVDKQSGKDF